MKNIFKYTGSITLFFLLASCVTTNDQVVIYNSGCDLEVFPSWDEVTKEHTVVGQASIRDKGLTLRCGEAFVMSKIQNAACAANADAIVMYDVIPPWTGGLFASSCFQASASFIKFNDP
tara:strand:- start:123 stop:479 length:357 start_codon:yes stop_codon:yes gene_type:complete